MAQNQTAYIGLARRWRPQIFNDLVGQEHVTRTLMNAIRTDRLGQSYLFTGTRGVGKTSSARIFAKAIRCPTPVAPAVPCNTCVDCVEIAEGRSINVLEIDGASNNGVDAVRELRENAKYMPSVGRYKIYIIDEVHMLTTAAFNALLKILEEPPAHLIFILATTDPQKIPATVLGRCQRYDFRRVSIKALSDRLNTICTAESVTINNDALAVLAREAEGSLRDGISLLEQAIAWGEKTITADTLTECLGLIDRRTIYNTLSSLLKRDAVGALTSAGQAHLYGQDLKLFTRELLRALRALMVMQVLGSKQSGNMDLLELTESELAEQRTLVGLRSNEDLDMLFCTLNYAIDDIARSPIAKTILDVVLIKMASATELVTIAEYEPPFEQKPAAVLVTAQPATAQPATAQPATAQPITAQPTPTPALIPTQTTSTPPPVVAPQLKPPAPAPVPASTPTAPSFTWTSFVNHVKTTKPMLGVVLEHATFEGLKTQGTERMITLGFSKSQSFYKDQLQLKSNATILIDLLKETLGGAVRLEYKEVLLSSSLEDAEQQRKEDHLKTARQTILNSQAMRAAQEVLGAKLDKLEIRGEL